MTSPFVLELPRDGVVESGQLNTIASCTAEFDMKSQQNLHHRPLDSRSNLFAD